MANYLDAMAVVDNIAQEAADHLISDGWLEVMGAEKPMTNSMAAEIVTALNRITLAMFALEKLRMATR